MCQSRDCFEKKDRNWPLPNFDIAEWRDQNFRCSVFAQSHKRKKTEVKRVAYAELLTSIENIADHVEKLIDDPEGLAKAYSSMNTALAMMDLIAPQDIHIRATRAFQIALLGRESATLEETLERKHYLNELTSLMRKDLGFESDDVIQEP